MAETETEATRAVSSNQAVEHAPESATHDGGGEQSSTTFSARGSIPGPQPDFASRRAPSASDLAFDEAPTAGQPLPADLRESFGASLGADLSDVRVHRDDPGAHRRNAKAYAEGNHIHFAPSTYDPTSDDGRLLIAHEVAHTKQQAGSTPVGKDKLEVSASGDRVENEADSAAAAMVAGQPANVTSAPMATMRKEWSRDELLDAYRDAVGRHAWTEVAQRLNGFNDGDIDWLLSSFTWFDLMKIKDAADTQRIVKAVDKADLARVRRAQAAYNAAVAASNWTDVARQLNGFDDSGITRSIAELADSEGGIRKLGYLKSAAIKVMPDHHMRVTNAIEAELAKRPPAPPDEIPHVASVELPDVTDDGRQLSGTPLENFATNAKVEDFARKLAEHHADHAAAKSKKGESREAIAAAKLTELRNGFASTGKVAPGFGYKTFAGFAHDWMSEMREKVDFDNGAWFMKFKTPTRPDWKDSELVDIVGGASSGQKVHPFVNKVIAALGSRATYSTYKDHGGKEWGPFCLDVFPKIALDDRGLYDRQSAMELVRTIHTTVTGLGGDWSSCYNDASLIDYANKELGNKLSYSGTSGTGNWHGALKRHFHLYLTPGDGGPGAVQSAPKIDVAHE